MTTWRAKAECAGLDETWEQFCARYTPGRYGRDATPACIAADVNEIRLLLTAARLRLDRYEAMAGVRRELKRSEAA